MPLFSMPRIPQVQVNEKPGAVRARIFFNGRMHECIVRCGDADELGAELERLSDGDDDETELGWNWKKALKKAVNPLTPLKYAHQITHKGPIEKLHKKVQAAVAKALPITKPFIKIHNSLAAPVAKAIEGKRIKKHLTAKAIADATKDLPATQKGAMQAALVSRAKQGEALTNIARGIAKASVLKQAKAAARKGDKVAKHVVHELSRGKKGTWQVKSPAGRIHNIPASKVT